MRTSPQLDSTLKEEPQQWIPSNSKLSIGGKSLKLYTSDHICSSWLNAKVDHFKVKVQHDSTLKERTTTVDQFKVTALL
jgi:hypothetical protein